MRILIQCISTGLEKRENVNESILKTHTGLCTKARYTRRKFTNAVNNRHRTSQSCQGSEMTTREIKKEFPYLFLVEIIKREKQQHTTRNTAE